MRKGFIAAAVLAVAVAGCTIETVDYARYSFGSLDEAAKSLGCQGSYASILTSLSATDEESALEIAREVGLDRADRAIPIGPTLWAIIDSRHDGDLVAIMTHRNDLVACES